MAIPRPRMHLRYAQPRIPVYLSRAKDIKDAFKVCPTPDPCLLVEGQRHKRFPGVPKTKSSILLTIRIHQIWWRVTGLPTTLDAFTAIPRPVDLNTVHEKQYSAASHACQLQQQ